VIINLPRRSRGRRIARRAGRAFRRAGRRTVRSAIPTITLAGASAAAGFLWEKLPLRGYIPEIGGSKLLTMGLVGWAMTKFVSNRWVRLGGTAMLASAAFDWGRVQGGGTGVQGEAY
jgi:hypothetical protein